MRQVLQIPLSLHSQGQVIEFFQEYLSYLPVNTIGKNLCSRTVVTWKKLTEKDCHEWKLTTVDPQEWSTWRSGVRSAMRAASQLPGKGPTDVDDAPAPAR